MCGSLGGLAWGVRYLEIHNALAGIVADTDSLWAVALDHIQHALRDKFGTDIDKLQHPFQGLHEGKVFQRNIFFNSKCT